MLDGLVPQTRNKFPVTLTQFWLKNQEKRRTAEYQPSRGCTVLEFSLSVDAHSGGVTGASGVVSERRPSACGSRSLCWVSATRRAQEQAQDCQRGHTGQRKQKASNPAAGSTQHSQSPFATLLSFQPRRTWNYPSARRAVEGGEGTRETKSRLSFSWPLVFLLLYQPHKGAVSPKIQILES